MHIRPTVNQSKAFSKRQQRASSDFRLLCSVDSSRVARPDRGFAVVVDVAGEVAAAAAVDAAAAAAAATAGP